MKFEDIAYERKSVKRFKKKKPSWKDVVNAVDLANQGPYAGNNNNLRYLIVENDKTIDRVAKLCEQTWIKESSLLIVVCSDDAYLEDLYGDRGRVYSRQQAGAAIQTIMLSLTEKGVDSCWVGSYDDEKVRAKLQIPGHIQIEAIIPVGFEAGKSSKPHKKDLDKSFYWESWDTKKRPTMFKEHPEDYRPAETG